MTFARTLDITLVTEMPRQFVGPMGADVLGMLVMTDRVHLRGIVTFFHTCWTNSRMSLKNMGFLMVSAEMPSSPRAELRSLHMAR